MKSNSASHPRVSVWTQMTVVPNNSHTNGVIVKTVVHSDFSLLKVPPSKDTNDSSLVVVIVNTYVAVKTTVQTSWRESATALSPFPFFFFLSKMTYPFETTTSSRTLRACPRLPFITYLEWTLLSFVRNKKTSFCNRFNYYCIDNQKLD